MGEYWIAEGPVTTTTFEKELTNGVLSVLSEKGFTRTDCFVLSGYNIRKTTEYLLLYRTLSADEVYNFI